MLRTSALRRPRLAAVHEQVAASPIDLLQRLDDWLENAGHESGSTWRRAISDTLAARQQTQLGAPRLAALFGEAAAVAHQADAQAIDLGESDDWQAEALRLRAVVCRLGWLADFGASLAGAEPVRGVPRGGC